MQSKTWVGDCQSCSARESGVFCQLEALAIKKLSHEKVSNSYKRGQALFFQGNPPFGLYCVHSGKIKITKGAAVGKETIVRIAAKGDILGHRSLFSDSPYTASAVALEDAEVCFISKKTIYDLLEQEPKLSLQILYSVSRDMGNAEDKVASIAQRNIRERFAELLLILKKAYGEPSSNGTRLNIRLTREEMASMIGTASESLIRLVSEFREDGIIEQKGKTIFLINDGKLKEYANL